jgi:3-oxoacyl-[acyl-carrier-protein] synthase-3
MYFVLGSDGSGAPHICMPGGAFRHPPSEESVRRIPDAEGIPRTLHESRMNGPEVFAFTLRVVPPLLHDALEAAQWSMDDLDAFVPHQANLFMLEHLRKRVKLPREKMVLALEDYGNTSSASIPLSIVARMNDRLRNAAMNVLLSGFGVGWSWGAAALRLGPLKLPPVVSIPAGARL